jgi:hypothetical protein
VGLARKVRCTYNRPMDPNIIIDKLGGTSAVAKLCEVKVPSVSEWRHNGIPKARLMYLRAVRPEVFDEPQQSEPKAA